MDPATLALVALAVRVLEAHAPEIIVAVKPEPISPEEQLAAREKYLAVAAAVKDGSAFSAPHWQPSTTAVAPIADVTKDVS